MSGKTRLPHWDVSNIYPSLDSDEFRADFDQVGSSITALQSLFDRHGVRGSVSSTPSEDEFEEVLSAYNELRAKLERISPYISAFTSTDSRNQLAQSKSSEMTGHSVELSRFSLRLEAWVGTLDLEKLLERSEMARDHEFPLRKFQNAASHQMSEAEEEVAARLAPTGSGAWSRLYGNLTSRLLVDLERQDGSTERLPMSAVRMMFRDDDSDLRRAAFESELVTWEKAEVPLAAALNSIKGERNVLNARRGWKNALEPALFSNNVDKAILEAMQTACIESFPDFRRYLKAKAHLLGKEALPWWDIGAPVGKMGKWSYQEAQDVVIRSFFGFSDRLGELAKRAFKESWIDAEPREGKVDGAFCMGVGNGDSRILTQFTYTYGSVNSLAHELGHAYHVLNLAQRTHLQRATPMALAETASTFCEDILARTLADELPGPEKLSLLDFRLASACQQILDIHSRFTFEKAVFEQREARELSVEELKTTMLDAQRETYGDGLDHNHLHPYMWAAKVHYYGSSYYNWPYSFGLLFGLGLYARSLEDPEGFKPRYDDLLSSTGMADVATLGTRFGIDFSSIDFWRSSLSLLREQIDEFENLAKLPVLISQAQVLDRELAHAERRRRVGARDATPVASLYPDRSSHDYATG